MNIFVIWFEFNGVLCHFNRFACFYDKEIVQTFSDFIACSIQFDLISHCFGQSTSGGRDFCVCVSSLHHLCVYFERVEHFVRTVLDEIYGLMGIII